MSSQNRPRSCLGRNRPRGCLGQNRPGSCLGLLALVLGAIPAQAGGPQLPAHRISTSIVVDGDLSEADWQAAAVATDFTQREPREGQPATETTQVRVLYTADTLYVGVQAHDSSPGSIVAKEMERDGLLHRDDSFVVLLDTFHDRRNAYVFETNANGARSDALITDEGRDINREWDGVWTAAARRTAQGWATEIAIPFSTLRFDPALETWGVNFRRLIRHKNEEVNWAPLSRDVGSPRDLTRYAIYRVSLAGELTGIRDIQPSRQLDVKPFVIASASQSPGTGRSDTRFDEEVGLDVKWGLGRALALDLTLNTDFAEVEVDEEQVNLTRFSLFFPEKRDFFLENAGIFEFGLPNRDPLEPELMKIFFSRRIGLDAGQEVPIDWGARLTGRVGQWNLGVLNVLTDDAALDDGPRAEDARVSVFRAKRNLGQRSGLGMIFTERDESGPRSNQVYGVDFDYKPSNKIDVAGFVAASRQDVAHQDEWAGGYGFGYRGRDLRASFEHSEVAEGFDPGVGFLLRNNYERFHPLVRYRPRIHRWGIRTWFFEALVDYFARSSDGRLESRKVSLSALGMRTVLEDGWGLNFVSETERLFEPFEIRPGIVIPTGLYRFDGWQLGGRSNPGRPVSVQVRFNIGDFFTGTRRFARIALATRGSRYFRAETSWNANDIDLPQGAFTTSVVGQRLSFSFSPDLRLNAFLQYNDATELAAANLRLHWIYKPGAALFVVYNENWDAPTLRRRTPRDRQFIVKFTYLFQR